LSRAAAGVTAIILAGQRPGGDRLAEHVGATHKALIEIEGEPMLSHVVRAVAADGDFARILVISQEEGLLRNHPKLGWTAQDRRIEFASSAPTISKTVEGLLEEVGSDGRLFVTTADNPLLQQPILDTFLAGAAGSDVAVGLVERGTLLAAYPDSRRTWLPFRGGSYSGANLFWLGGGSSVRPLLDVWRRIEQDRKRRWRVVGAFGPLMLIAALLRLYTVEQAFGRIGERFGATARPVILPFPEACIDVDKLADLELVTRILARSGGADSSPGSNAEQKQPNH
jgi:CTP:molybdopterin cytidylyltransferase MocA